MFYTYVDSTNDGTPFYVGKGNDARVKGLKRNKKHSAVGLKHGFQRKIVLETEDEQLALDTEISLIAELHTFVDDPEAGHLASNLTKGGEGCTASTETRKKMSDAKKGKPGKPCSVATRQRMSDAKKGKPGKPHSAEARQRISDARKGKPHSIEARQRISDAKKGKPGKPCSVEARQRMSDAKKGRTWSLVDGRRVYSKKPTE